MIKFLISIIIINLLLSCKEFQTEQISTKINNQVKKIEKSFEKKDVDIQISDKQNKDNIFYYIGDPYFIEGVEYIPEENYSYSEIGLASFYGKELHNSKTINNDYNKVTELLGRHKTLPIPSMVKITNLENGLSINIKIIDRHNDNSTIIDVSRKVAQLLGFYKDKIATVRVDILSDSSKQWKNVSMSLNEEKFNDTISSAPTSIVSISEIDSADMQNNDDDEITQPVEILSEEVKEFDLFLKVSNFDDYNAIKTVINDLDKDIKYTSEKNGINFDLILGPVDKKEINNIVSYFISKGYKETKIILN